MSSTDCRRSSLGRRRPRATLLKTAPVVTIFFFSAVFLMFVECDSAHPHSLLRDHEVEIQRLNGYMNSISSSKVLVKSLTKKVQMKKQPSLPRIKEQKNLEKRKFLKGLFLRFRAKVKEKAMSACYCSWPEITSDGASEEQPCPPPPIKCEICMNAINAVRFENHPVNYCGASATVSRYYDFCFKAGNEVAQVYGEVHHIIKELTIKFGTHYGASAEICMDMGCCNRG